jgi:hypothetical protein
VVGPRPSPAPFCEMFHLLPRNIRAGEKYYADLAAADSANPSSL